MTTWEIFLFTVFCGACVILLGMALTASPAQYDPDPELDEQYQEELARHEAYEVRRKSMGKHHTTPVTPAEKIDAAFHNRLKHFVNKRLQGVIMGELREILSAYDIQEKPNEHEHQPLDVDR